MEEEKNLASDMNKIIQASNIKESIKKINREEQLELLKIAVLCYKEKGFTCEEIDALYEGGLLQQGIITMSPLLKLWIHKIYNGEL